ncbi:hypothetical protein FHU35_16149 [Saccharopolyspora dendranthemae]|uniref:Novel STAND NTPase 1 domain-containing protein n=1 Tax=Saccharopolyspora dendranthemae TaxID=1181886 RepID=A0A561U0G4_9PSEU|nr:hypothetical protein [Saccharopolyspora dendranthemae]TWF92867.1 hypothetical protein FHU35_16149 [Saccharopolyspora dendranthemae]
MRRILDDTAAGTGALPLVSLVLQELCERRRGGWLTHEDYEALGRVPGALSAAADAALAELDNDRARSLLTLLTRPDGEGGHARRSAELGDLDASSRNTAHQLAAKRLVVIEDQRVNLTHQALIDHWPRLRDWLTEDADFLSWRAKLTDLHDSGGVLRDAPLAEAESWLAARPDDIPEAQRQFVRRSTAAQTRDRRRWRNITAVVSVLALVAAVLVVITTRSNAQLDQRLREADATTLAEESTSAAEGNSATALQLALAAYKTDPDSPAAIGALLRQRLFHRGVDRVLSPELTGVLSPYDSLQVSADGRTAITVATDPTDPVRVIRDPAGPRPRSEPLQVNRENRLVLSSDGASLAELDTSGALTLWDLTGHHPPMVLADSGVDYASFSHDGQWLLTMPEETTEVATLWNVPARQRHPTGYVKPSGITRSAFPLPGGHHIVSQEDRSAPGQPGDEPWTVVRDTRTGAELSARNGWSLLDSGVSSFRCADSSYTVADTLTGRELTQGTAGECHKTDNAGRHLLIRGSGSSDSVHEVVDSSGKRSGLTDPARTWFSGTTSSEGTSVVTGPRGTLTALTSREGSVHISDLRTTSEERLQPESVMVTSPDGNRLVASNQSQQAHVLDGERRFVGRLDVPSYEDEGSFAFDTTGEQLISMLPGKLRVQNAADLSVLREIPIPGPPGFGDEFNRYLHLPSLVSTKRDEVLIEYRGQVTGFDPETWRITRPPLNVLPGKGPNTDWSSVSVVGRPGHPDEVLVRSDESLTTWNLRTRSSGPAIAVGPTVGQATPATDPAGRYAAVTASKVAVVVDLDENRPVESIPIDAAGAYGFFGDYLLLDGTAQLEVLDWRGRKVITEFTTTSSGGDVTVENGRLFLSHFGGPSDSIPGEPQSWFAELCGVSDRDYTDAERALVREELAEERPCEG